MKNVMWKGELEGVINLDTMQEMEGLCALGPLEYLAGEVMILNGDSYISQVLSDTTMEVIETFKGKAPFLVYTDVHSWKKHKIKMDVHDLPSLETHLEAYYESVSAPFAFAINGLVDSAGIHIQNLPKGRVVSSPEEAHAGQTNYRLENLTVNILGFYSKTHQGVFTHHDTFMHLHLISEDRSMMGHLDWIHFDPKDVELSIAQ
jgi:acetolactate decarboxylase